MPKKILEDLRSFCETTSVRGIPRVMKAKTKVTFFIWTLGVCTCAALLVWQLSVVLTRYFQYSVNTLTVQSPAWDRPTFPDITICNVDPLIYEENLNFSVAQSYNQLYSEKMDAIYSELYNNFKSSNGSQIFDEIFFYYLLLEEFGTLSTTWINWFPLARTFSFLSDYGASPIITSTYIDWFGNSCANNCSATITAAWNPTYYKCFTMALNDADRKNFRGLSAVLYNNQNILGDKAFSPIIASGLRVLVHAPGTAPDMTLAVSVSPGTETTVMLTQNVRTRLGRPYSNCTDQQHLTGDDTSDAYTQRYCVNACIQQKIVDGCGCVSSMVPQYSMAQLRQVNFTICANVSADFYPSFVCSIQLLSNASLDASCDASCVIPCSELQYSAIPSFAPWSLTPLPSYKGYQYYLNYSSFGALYVYVTTLETLSATAEQQNNAIFEFDNYTSRLLKFNVQFGDPTYSELKDVAAFSADAMGAQIGGVLSLWLGVTVMIIFEAFEFFYTYLASCRKDGPTQDRHSSVAPVAEKEPSPSVMAQVE